MSRITEGDPVLSPENVEQSKSLLVEQDAEKAVAALAPDNSPSEKFNSVKGKVAAETVDDFYKLGRYTYIVCVFAGLLILCQTGNMLYMTYAGAAPKVVGCGTHKFEENMTASERCKELKNIFADSSKKTSLGCNESTVELSVQFNSVNVDFDDYYCRNNEVKSTISIQMIGVILGSIVFGYLSDSYGRRKIMLIALVCCILCMLATSFTQDLVIFTAVRFFVNFFNAGTMVILVVFTSEHYPKKHRFCLSNLITFSPNYVIFAVMAWYCGDWRILHRASAMFALPCIVLLVYLSESLRFLIQSRRVEEAKIAILRMHRIDGRPCDEALLDSVLEHERCQFLEASGKKKYNYLHLFYTWRFIRYNFALAFSFLVASLMNYSLLFNMDKLSGSLFLNGIFMGSFRYSINLIIAFLDLRFKRLGRKLSHFMADALAAVGLFVYVVVFISSYKEDFAMVSRFAILSVIGFCSILYTTNGLASNELFPTGIRNTSYSFGQVLSRIGVVLAAQLFVLTSIWELLPFIVLLVLAVSDALFFQFNVIETKGRPLISNFPPKSERIFYGRIPLRQGREKPDVELIPRGEQDENGGGDDNNETKDGAE